MALLLKPDLERLMPRLPTTEPVADDKLYMNGPFLALSGIENDYLKLVNDAVLVPTILTNSGGNHVVFDAPMPVGANFTKTSPFRILNNATFFGGFTAGVPSGWDSHSPDQPFALGRIPAGQAEGQDPTYSIAQWVHEVDYMVGPAHTAQERYDVLRCAGPGSDVHWDYPSGDYPDARRCGYCYEAFSNDQGNHSAGTVSLSIIGDGVLFTSNYCNPHNPSIGEVGPFASLAPSQSTGGVTWTIGTTQSVTMQTITSATQTVATSSGDLYLQGAGEVNLTETSENMFVRINNADSKQIDIYADGSGKSIRIGGASTYVTISQSLFSFTGPITSTDTITATTAVMVPASSGYIDLNSANPNKTKLYSDAYRFYFFALDASDTSIQIGAMSAYDKSITFRTDCRIGWGTDLFTTPSHGLRLNSGTVQVISSADAILPIEAKLVLSPIAIPASSTATGVAGQVTFDDNYFYLCTATDTWSRFAKSAW